MATVLVPNVIGLGRSVTEQRLALVQLRFIARFPFSAAGEGSASAQVPAAGSSVNKYSIVVVDYPSPLGPLDDSPVLGPVPTGLIEGAIGSVTVNDRGATIGMLFDNGTPFDFGLYDEAVAVGREGWMRRGAMLALAQRAFSDGDKVRVNILGGMVASIQIFR